MHKFLVSFAYTLQSFRIAELVALAELEGIDLQFNQYAYFKILIKVIIIIIAILLYFL